MEILVKPHAKWIADPQCLAERIAAVVCHNSANFKPEQFAMNRWQLTMDNDWRMRIFLGAGTCEVNYRHGRQHVEEMEALEKLLNWLLA